MKNGLEGFDNALILTYMNNEHSMVVKLVLELFYALSKLINACVM